MHEYHNNSIQSYKMINTALALAEQVYRNQVVQIFNSTGTGQIYIKCLVEYWQEEAVNENNLIE